MMGHMVGFPGIGIGMWIVPLLIAAAVLWGVWRLLGQPAWSPEDRVHVEELLRERYERGDIDRTEFERRLASIHRPGF